MLSVTNDFKTALTQPRQIDAKVLVNNSTTLDSSQLNSIRREFSTGLFKSVLKKVTIDSNEPINKGDIVVPSMGVFVGNDYEYLSLGSYKAIEPPNLNKDTKSYEISTYDKIVECMTKYALTSSDRTFPCSVRQLFVAIFTKLGWATSGIPSTFVNSTSQIEEDVYSNLDITYRDVLDELCTISCMFLVDKNGVPTLIQKTTTSEVINEEFMKDTNVAVKDRVFFNSLVFARVEDSDNIVRKDDASISANGLHEFRVSNLQILSLNWRDNFIDAMWNYIKTFEYYSYEIDTIGIGYLEPIDAFTLSTFGDTYSTLLLNDDLTIRDGISERIYADAPQETQTDYKYASDTDRKINQTYIIVDKQNGKIDAVVSRVDEVETQVDDIENDLSSPTTQLSGTSFDIEDALDQPLQDFKMYGDTQQDSTTGKNKHSSPIVQGTISAQGQNVGATTRIRTSNFVPVSANTQYTISAKESRQVFLFEYNGSTFIQRIPSDWTNLPYTFTTSANTTNLKYIFRFTDNATITPSDISEIQLEAGNQATSYEPYTGGSPAPSPSYPFDIHNVSGDNLIEICGKNLFDKDNITSSKALNTQNGTLIDSSVSCVLNYTEVEPNTTYTLSGGTDATKTKKVCYYTTQATSTYLSGNEEVGTGITFTTPNNCYYIRIQVVEVEKDNMQLEKGNQSSAYTPYVSQAQLISLGVENLYNPEQTLEQGQYRNGVWEYNATRVTSDYIEIEQGKTYTISCDLENLQDVALINYNLFDENKTWLGNRTTNGETQSFSGDKTHTFKINLANSKYLRISFLRYSNGDQALAPSVVESALIQLEKGSKANSYTPYGTTPIELNKNGNNQDYIHKTDKWYIHKEIGKMTLVGTEDYTIFSSTDTRVAIGTDTISDLETYSLNTDLPNLVCNYFTPVSQADTWVVGLISRRRQDSKIYFMTEPSTTLEQWKTWLSTHNTKVYYVLSTPQEIEITDTTLLEQLNNLMTIPLIKDLTHIIITPNDLTPTLDIEYLRNTSINENFVRQPQLNNYYTRVETDAQINISSNEIQQSVIQLETLVDSNGDAISSVSNQVQNLQTSTSTQINTINQKIENGVETLVNNLVTIDINGINVSTNTSKISTIMTNSTFAIKDTSNTYLAYFGYDEVEGRSKAEMDNLTITNYLTAGAHRQEKYEDENTHEIRTGYFYIGGGN